MTYEVELKFRCPDVAPVRARAVELGAVPRGPLEQTDQYFNHPARDFALTDEVLRLRYDGQSLYVTYKGPKADDQTKTRHEIEVPFGQGSEDLARMTALLQALGFRTVAVVRKKRDRMNLEWRGQTLEIAIDRVEGIGDFIEIEALADDATLDESRLRVWDLARQLGLQDSEWRSYLELLLASGNPPP